MRAASVTTWTTTVLTSLALAGGLAWGRQGRQEVSAGERRPAPRLPWREAGLGERQAAAHLLNRFAFGPRPGEVDHVVAAGLDRWFEQQLGAALPDPNLEARLAALPALAMSQADMVRIYKNPGQILAEAVKEGVIRKDELAAAQSDQRLKRLYAAGNFAGNANGRGRNGGGAGGDSAAAVGETGTAGAGAVGADAAAGAGGAEIDRPELRARLLAFARNQGYRPERELDGQLLAQKLLRAAESQNQLREVMTDFWFNHFNVSQTNGRARPYLLSYERDAIRPKALGTVRGLLEATSHHPAMLYYLDNAESTAAPDEPTLFGDEMQEMQAARRPRGLARQPNVPKGRGLNENYARELMELHTLGVDGGYTQKDVIEVARAFTGWTVLPSGPAREGVEKRLDKVRRFGGLGFHVDGDFLFRADMHDSAVKKVLGRTLPPGRGIEDGEEVLDLLAGHPSTARHLATQLAVRFVSDRPPRQLIDRLVATYDRTGGDVRALLRTLAQSPEFWSPEAVGAKVKSPFELAVSAVRASGAHVEDPQQLLGWIRRMGEPLYAYQAPTGYPDRADAWVNTGALLNRMNFGLQFASQRIGGVDMDLPSLHDGPEPESREAALRTYAALLLPGRDLAATLRLLGPLVSDPAVAHRIDEAAPKEALPAVPARDNGDEMAAGSGLEGAGAGGGRQARGERQGDGPAALAALAAIAGVPRHPPTPLEQVVGMVLGSPEFQRR